MFDCDLHDALLILISSNARNMVYFLFKILLANFRGEKGSSFMMGPGRHLASLRHCTAVHK